MTISLLTSLIAIALLDSLNPSLFVAQFYLITTPRPTPRILSYIGGVVLVNFAGGLVLLGGAQTLVVHLLNNLHANILYGMQLALGLGLLLFGLWFRVSTTTRHEVKKPRSLHPLHTFALGAVVMLNEITTALPYFAAIERITQAQLSIINNLLALTLYNVVFSAPLLGFLVLFLTFRQRFASQLERISWAIQRWTSRVIKYGSIGFGAALTLHATTLLITGANVFG